MKNQTFITIITGKKGDGKTTFLKELIKEFENKGKVVGGVISPGVFDHEKKIGIDVINLKTKEIRRLAISEPGWDPEMPLREWRFDNEIVRWGNEVLEKQTVPCDVLIVDEVGYLELEKRKGWISVFNTIRSSEYKYAYIVVREDLLSLALNAWEKARVINLQDIVDYSLFIQDEVSKYQQKNS